MDVKLPKKIAFIFEESGVTTQVMVPIQERYTAPAWLEFQAMRKALKELCEVRILKNVQGDTPEYRERKPKAWEAAFACFPEYEK